MSQDAALTNPTITDAQVPTPEELKARFGRDIFNDFDLDDPVFNDKFYEILDTMVDSCPVGSAAMSEPAIGS